MKVWRTPPYTPPRYPIHLNHYLLVVEFWAATPDPQRGVGSGIPSGHRCLGWSSPQPCFASIPSFPKLRSEQVGPSSDSGSFRSRVSARETLALGAVTSQRSLNRPPRQLTPSPHSPSLGVGGKFLVRYPFDLLISVRRRTSSGLDSTHPCCFNSDDH